MAVPLYVVDERGDAVPWDGKVESPPVEVKVTMDADLGRMYDKLDAMACESVDLSPVLEALARWPKVEATDLGPLETQVGELTVAMGYMAQGLAEMRGDVASLSEKVGQLNGLEEKLVSIGQCLGLLDAKVDGLAEHLRELAEDDTLQTLADNNDATRQAIDALADAVRGKRGVFVR